MRAALLSILLALLAGGAAARPRPLVRHQWLNESNTPVKVNDLLQTKAGYIWIATDQGLYRYNGNTFTRMYDSRINGVTALAIWNNKLVAALKNGNLATVRRDTLTPLPVWGFQPKQLIRQICADDKQNLWLATEAGLVRIATNGEAVSYTSESGLSDDFVYSMLFLKGGNLLITTDRGINRLSFPNKTSRPAVRTITTAEGLPDNIIRVIRQLGNTSHFIAGSMDGGIAIYDAVQDRLLPFTENVRWTFGPINDILVLDKNKALAATDLGYIVTISIGKGNILHYDPLHLPDKKCYKLLSDISGNIWCGTSTGISMLTSEYLEYVPLAMPFSLAQVTALGWDNSRKLWIALQNKLYFVNVADEEHQLTMEESFPDPISSLHIDGYGRLWVGTLGGGIYRRNKSGNFIRIGIKEESVLSIASDATGLWIAGLNGVRIISYPDERGNTRILQWHNKASGLGSDYVYQLYPDSQGNMWMATDGGGIKAYRNGRYRQWAVFNHPDYNVAYSICEDAAHRIWAGLLYKDLFRLDSGRWVNVRAEKRDIDAGISTIKANATGAVVCVYKRCIDVWHPGSNIFRHFNYRQGLGIDSTSIVLNCGAADKEGNVYLPYQHGILIFKNHRRQFDIRPRIRIARIRNYSDDIPFTKTTFAPGDNYINFIFEGISFSNPERLHYRYKLSGYNEEWIYTREPAATFARLPPGHYTFLAEASLSNVFSGAETASFSFRIDTPLWRKPWFLALALLAAGGGIYAYIRYRERNLRRVSQLEQERILFEYEHLKSQINPHFLFNSLNTLANLIEENTAAAVDYTTNLSDMYRELLIHRDKNLIPLETEWEILSAYLHIQQSRFGKALVISADIPKTLMQQKRIIPIALQLLVENAIKHNVVSAAHPLYISITANEQEIRITNTVRPKITPEPSSGVGLNNIKRRYALITDRPVSFGLVEEKWVVTLPLL